MNVLEYGSPAADLVLLQPVDTLGRQHQNKVLAGADSVFQPVGETVAALGIGIEVDAVAQILQVTGQPVSELIAAAVVAVGNENVFCHDACPLLY